MATIEVLFSGYVGGRTASTVSLVRDGEASVVIDPGMVPDQRDILEPLRRLGVDPAEVSDVVLSHHHPDHTMNAGLFPGARVHDHWAIYQGDLWTDRRAEGFSVAPGVRLIDPRPYPTGHHHLGVDRRRGRRLHPPVVERRRSTRRSLRHRPRSAPRRPRPSPGAGNPHRPRARQPLCADRPNVPLANTSFPPASVSPTAAGSADGLSVPTAFRCHLSCLVTMLSRSVRWAVGLPGAAPDRGRTTRRARASSSNGTAP